MRSDVRFLRSTSLFWQGANDRYRGFAAPAMPQPHGPLSAHRAKPRLGRNQSDRAAPLSNRAARSLDTRLPPAPTASPPPSFRNPGPLPSAPAHTEPSPPR